MCTRIRVIAALSLLLAADLRAAPPAAQRPLDQGALARIPIREVTVFKDGHAFVLHEGEMPVDETGNVVLDYLPAPVLGTFWPYAADPKQRLASVVAGRRKVRVDRTALNLRELLEANTGTAAVITERDNTSYLATILGIPARPAKDAPSTNRTPRGTSQRQDRPPQKGDVVLIETHEGVKVLPIDRIRDLTFKAPPKRTVAEDESRDLLTLRLDWGQHKPEPRARVGLVYLQKGLRWIPSYKITTDGKGTATVRLQATLLNELTDLEDVTTHLVIGVPTFRFKDTLDPIALQEAAAELSQYFRESGQTAFAFSNAVMTQSARMSEHRQPAPPRADLGPDMLPSARNEDLFVFTLEHVTLKKGQRMVLPVAEFTLRYKDVYVLDVPFVPPPEVRKQFDNAQQAELAHLFAKPKVMHKIRLTNSSEAPLTTAPALILQDTQVVAQGMMTYTAVGATTDLELTAAVDIQVTKTDVETERVPNAAKWHNQHYDRIHLAGTIGLTNYRNEAVEIEVVRHVLGNPDSADHDGQIEKVNVQEEGWFLESGGFPHWWRSHAWPAWWHQFNGIGQIKWSFKLQPGKKIELKYTWHYYWG